MRTGQHRSASCIQGKLVVALGVVSLVVFCGIVIASDDLPAFRQGMWKLTRTVAGKLVETHRCTNPGDDMKRQNAMLQKAGCTFSPVRRSGNTYTFDTDCALNGPRGGGMTSHTTTVMIVEGDSAYRLEVTGTQDGAPMKETLVARRDGDCVRQ